MVSLDSTYLVDLLRRRPTAVRAAERIRDAGEERTIAPPAAVEVLTGGHFLGGAHLEQARELLASLRPLPFDDEAIDLTARVAAELLARGISLGQADLLIAGISLRHGEPVLTRDTAFARVPGLAVRTY
jgi:predicted nucleic acid-binding protein